MKNMLFSVVAVLVLLAIGLFTAHAATQSDIYPCGLIAPEAVYAAFPALKSMKKQTIGPSTTCSYLDKFGISALIVSVHRDNGESAKGMLSGFGEGYRLEPVAGLGQEAAMAISLGNQKYNIPGGEVAELYIKKGGRALLLAPARIKVKADGPSFEKLKNMAMKMLDKL